MQTKVISALHKVFPDSEPEDFLQAGSESVLLNETYSFQTVYIGGAEKKWFKVKTRCSKDYNVKIYSVGLVPSELPAYAEYDDNYIKTEPGLYPDVLRPIGDGYECFAQPGFWRALWVDVVPDEKNGAGVCEISLDFIDEDGNLIASAQTSFEVIGANLPKQQLIHTEWFHCDCISNYYNVPMMSDEHWALIKKYIEAAAALGINMILTPLFTPPLDTKVGGDRPTMQLVDVEKTETDYVFNFKKLKSWIDMCLDCGIEYFEMSHLFTQWGALHAPKIMADIDGENAKIFGWETDASGEEYASFLHSFLPQLTKKIKEWGIVDRVRFHISDEPQQQQLESYRKAVGIVKEYLKDFKIMDALSDIDFYETGLVGHPIPASNHIEPFLDKKIEGLWTYYCCGQNLRVANRFFAMPSARNRILGFQLFKFDIEGFLHWGFNFWNSQYSKRALNPYETTDADCAFPSGDAFLVYPGVEGPVLSIRAKVFFQAICDLRALKMLASFTSKEYVVDLLEKDLRNRITFSEYPKDLYYIVNMRKKINNELKSILKGIIHNVRHNIDYDGDFFNRRISERI